MAIRLTAFSPFDDATVGQAEARRPRGFDRDQVAFLGVAGRALRNAHFLAEHFLVDRL